MFLARNEMIVFFRYGDRILPLLLCVACGGRAEDSRSSGSIDHAGASSAQGGRASSATGNDAFAGAAGEGDTGASKGGTAGRASAESGGQPGDRPLEPWGEAQAQCDGFAKVWTTSSCNTCIEQQGALCDALSSWLFTDCSTSFNCADSHCLSCRDASCSADLCGCLNDCQVVGQSAACREGWVKFMTCYEPCTDSCQ